MKEFNNQLPVYLYWLLELLNWILFCLEESKSFSDNFECVFGLCAETQDVFMEFCFSVENWEYILRVYF